MEVEEVPRKGETDAIRLHLRRIVQKWVVRRKRNLKNRKRRVHRGVQGEQGARGGNFANRKQEHQWEVEGEPNDGNLLIYTWIVSVLKRELNKIGSGWISLSFLRQGCS